MPLETSKPAQPRGIRNNNPGDFSGNPGVADNFVAMLNTGLAAAKAFCTDRDRATAAYTKFQKFQKCDYSNNPKYNILPRAA